MYQIEHFNKNQTQSYCIRNGSPQIRCHHLQAWQWSLSSQTCWCAGEVNPFKYTLSGGSFCWQVFQMLQTTSSSSWTAKNIVQGVAVPDTVIMNVNQQTGYTTLCHVPHIKHVVISIHSIYHFIAFTLKLCAFIRLLTSIHMVLGL